MASSFLSLALNLLLTSQMIQAQEPYFATMGDFIELHQGLRYCNTAAGAGKKLGEFGKCSWAALGSRKLSDLGDFWTRLCQNQQKYLDCWKPIVETSKSCNAGTNRGAPSVYNASLKAICKNDQGKTNAAAFKAALNQTTTQECSASGDHWMKACAPFEQDMNSDKSCTRFRGMFNCLDKILCKEQAAGKLMLDLYKDAGPHAGC